MPHRPLPGHQLGNARRLRRAMTEVERKLWGALRGHRLAGASFRRQVPVGPYIADFVCHEARLVIELDGSQHGEAAGMARDAARDRYLAEAGYRVLRFWNREINAEFEAVMERIHTALVARGLGLEPSVFVEADTPHPVPPPQGGRGR